MNVELSAMEARVCWEQLGLAEFPLVIDVPAEGFRDAERRQLVARARTALRARGLLGRDGVHPPLAHLLTTLARPELGIEAWLLLDHPVRALAARRESPDRRDDIGALAVLRQGRLRISACSPYTLIGEVIRLAGISPGPGRSVTVRAENLDAAVRVAGANLRRVADELVQRGERRDDADALALMCTGHYRLGQFGVLVRDPAGVRRAGRRVIGLHATPDGWYSQLRRADLGGTFVTVTPAGTDVVVTQVSDLITEVRQQVGVPAS